MKPEDIREKIGLSRGEWARALNVSMMTVVRWEDDDVEPAGLASDVLRAIANAIEDGADPKKVGRKVSLGIGALIFTELMKQLSDR